MNINLMSFKTPYDVSKELAKKAKEKRKYMKLTQMQLADKSGVSLSSLKRFERTGEISLSSPLEKRLFIPDYRPFEGVYGVFADSLPDGCGRLIVDRYIKSKFKINADDIDSFQRLTLVSDSGRGSS